MTRRDRRRALVEGMRQLDARGLNHGTSGNLSVRDGGGLLVTPTGIPAGALAATDMVPMAMDGSWRGRRAPSSEWRFHRDIYARRDDAAAIVHVHSPFATTLACLRRDIPAFHYMIAAAGGDSVRCAAYATFGTQALSDHALAALEGRRACLLANHGMIALAADLDRAIALAVEVEALAEQYWRALQIGPPALLDDTEMARVIEKFRSYGQPKND